MAAAGSTTESPRLGQDIFEARLTDALLARGLVTSEKLQEALRQQVLLGGHLATNLWELHLVEGKELTQLSAEILNVPIADPKDVGGVPADVRRLFSRDFIEQLRVLPMRIVGSVLQVATAEPWDLMTLGRAAYQCGYPVEPHFVAEVPLAALMEKIYSIPTTARFWFGVQTNERRAQKAAKGEVESEQETAARRSALMTYVTSEVAKLRTRRKRRGAPEPEVTAPAAAAAVEPPAPPEADAAAEADAIAEADAVAEADAIAEADAVAEAPAAGSEAGTAEAATGGIGRDEAIDAASAAASAARLAPPRPRTPAVAMPGARLIVQPLDQISSVEAAPEPITSLAEANALLDAATDRDEVGSVLLRFALGKGKRVIVFVRRALLWAGWLGAGEAVDVRHLSSLLMPTAPGTIFGLVAGTGAHFLGPLAPHPVYAPFLAALGGARPRTCALLPVHFHGRLVFGVYVDGGPGKRVTADISDLVILAQRVPAALERLIRQRVEKRS
jgi:hypothetical protein